MAAHYASVQLPWRRSRLCGGSWAGAVQLRVDSERERKAQERRLRKLQAERKKLVDAHYADAVPLDLLKSEQDRLTAGIANAEGRLAEIAADFKAAEANLERALTRAGDCEAAYREATPTMRRQFNLAFFKRLLVGDDDTIAGELAEPFDAILWRGAAPRCHCQSWRGADRRG